jgi:multidrug resistance protein, MATE family
MSTLPIAAVWLGVTWFGWGLLECWTVITLWVSALGLIYLTRFLQGRWRTMRVVEPEILADEPDEGTVGTAVHH